MTAERIKVADLECDKETFDILQLQDKLLYLLDNGIPDLCQYLLQQTRFLRNPDQLSSFVQILLSIIRIRSFTIEIYVDLIRALFLLKTQDNALEFLPTQILNQFSLDIQRSDVINTVVAEFRLIRLLFNFEFFSMDNLTHFIREFMIVHRNYIESISLLFCYFAGDLYQNDLTLYNSLFNMINKKIFDDNFRKATNRQNSQSFIPKCISSFISTVSTFSDPEHWIVWKDLVNRVTYQDQLSAAIRKDDIDKFDSIIISINEKHAENQQEVDIENQEHFDWNMRIMPDVFEHHYILQNEPTILQYACYFGSMKIYQRILDSKQADITLLDKAGRSASSFAFAGFKTGIVTDLADRGINLEGSLKTAAEFHILTLFISLEQPRKIPHSIKSNEQQNNSSKMDNTEVIKDVVQHGFESFHQAARSNNFYVLHFFLRYGVNINVCDAQGKTALHYATINGNDSMVKLLLSIEDVSPNIHDKDWFTPIHYSIRQKNLYCVKQFVDSLSVDINAKDSTEETPLHTILIVLSLQPYLRFDKSIDMANSNLKNNEKYIINTYLQNIIFEIFRILLSVDTINVNAVDQAKMAPLHWILQIRCVPLLEELFEQKALDLNIDLVDDFDESIRDYVRNSRDQEIIDCFCKHTNEDKNNYKIDEHSFGMNSPRNSDSSSDKTSEEEEDEADSDDSSDDEDNNEDTNQNENGNEEEI